MCSIEFAQQQISIQLLLWGKCQLKCSILNKSIGRKISNQIYSVTMMLWKVLFILIQAVFQMSFFIPQRHFFPKTIVFHNASINHQVLVCQSRQTEQSQLQYVIGCLFIQTKAFGNCSVFLHMVNHFIMYVCKKY